jgi:hypothetical protein
MAHDEPDAGLVTPVRNRYSFGRLLGVDDFEREQGYANTKRRLANRLLEGHGVVAGLDVTLTDGPGLTVTPGVAIDGWGREVVVTTALPVDVLAAAGVGFGAFEILLCYGEEDGDPVPALGPEDGSTEASTTREVPRLEVRPATDASSPDRSSPVDAVLGGRADLVRLITRRPDAATLPSDPSVLLARVTVTADGVVDSVDIDVRPIVVSNALLLELLLGIH